MKKNIKELNLTPGVGLLHKALQIFDLFQIDRPNFSQSEIAKVTGMPRSTVNRLVKFLNEKKYLCLLDGQNRYSLGPASIDLGQRASSLFDLRGICRPILQSLSRTTGETVLLTSIVGKRNAVRCVDQIESTIEGLRVFEKIGAIFPLHAGASPKAVLAAFTDEEQDRYLSGRLDQITNNTITEVKEIKQELIETRKLGYSLSNGETYDGVVGIGAAFLWSSCKPAGSIAIALPSQRASSEKIKIFGQLLIEACFEINEILSIQKNPVRIEVA